MSANSYERQRLLERTLNRRCRLSPAAQKGLHVLLEKLLDAGETGSLAAALSPEEERTIGPLAEASLLTESPDAEPSALFVFFPDKHLVMTQRSFRLQKRLASKLQERARQARAASSLDELLPFVEQKGSLSIVTGGPGSGKTYSIKKITEHLEQKGIENIQLCAPTGKAAYRLHEVGARGSASTLQKLLEHFGNEAAAESWQTQVLIIDEASMLSTAMLERVLFLLSKESRLVLVGDAQQLPSIEAGQPFKDLCCAGEEKTLEAGFLKLTSNFRAGGTLPTVFEKSSLSQIDELLALFKEGAPDTAMHRLSFSQGDLSSFITNRASELRGLGSCLVFSSVSALDRKMARQEMKKIFSSAVLTPYQSSLWGARILSTGLQKALAPSKKSDLYPGAAMRVIKNDYTYNLFNGQLGVLVLCGGVYYFLPQDESAPLTEHSLIESILEPALAMTIHKSQGSEFESVHLLLPPPSEQQSQLLSWPLFYTGMTRARKQLSLYANSLEAIKELFSGDNRRESGWQEIRVIAKNEAGLLEEAEK